MKNFQLFHCFAIIVFTDIIHCYQPTVTLKLGTVTGLSENVNGKDANVFLGIPYAKPPIKELRFRKPQPLTEKWHASVEATRWPNECIQSELPASAARSEDCLYLNVWTPVNLQSDFTVKLKSVMVWIHGGAFVCGSISEPFHNASVLSTVGDVVVVTVNYRLGALGFMFGGRDEMPGNMGLYDQQLALEWIQENIAYFGGDKDSVTIFGESAGSMSVLYHMMSHDSKSLFKNAIAMSGVATDYLLTTSTITATKVRNRLSKLFGCQSHESEVISDSLLNCFKKVDSKRFAITGLTDSDGQLWFFPVYGEAFIPKRPEEMWREKLFKNNSNLLIGVVPNEGMIMPLQMGAIWNVNKTGEQMLREHLTQQFFSESLTLDSEDIEEITKFYFSGVQLEKQRDIYIEALGDLYFNCPMFQFAQHFAETNEVHQYLNDFNAKFKLIETLYPCEQCKPEIMGHADDVPFTFGSSPHKEDTEISLRWIKVITDFAKTGKNNWPAYYKTKYGDLVTKYYRIKNTEEDSDVMVGYRQEACLLWSKILRNDSVKQSAISSLFANLF